MPKYVDLDKVFDRLEDEWGYEGMRDDLYDLPTADVQEVRHGHWRDTTPPRFYACSCCGGAGHGIYKFCPWCGTKMDGGKSDE